MRKQYDFTNSRPKSFAKQLKRAVTIRLDEATLTYCRELAEETGIREGEHMEPSSWRCAQL